MKADQRDARIDGWIEEGIEMIVRKRLAAPLVQLALPAIVGAEHEKRRRAQDPGPAARSTAAR
jgi:hypothetical protein